jgi:hypothetical protein
MSKRHLDDAECRSEIFLAVNRRDGMRKILISATIGLAITLAGSGAKAQVDLSAYADPEGFLDIQALTCAQLAGTWQGSSGPAEFLVQRLVQRARKKALHGYQEGKGSRARVDRVLQGKPAAQNYPGHRCGFQKHAGKNGHQSAVREDSVRQRDLHFRGSRNHERSRSISIPKL